MVPGLLSCHRMGISCVGQASHSVVIIVCAIALHSCALEQLINPLDVLIQEVLLLFAHLITAHSAHSLLASVLTPLVKLLVSVILRELLS